MADPLTPSGKLDVSAVAAFHANLCERSGADVTLDLAEVSHVGALCLQVCLAAARAARAGGHAFSIINVSDAVAAQLHSMGFTPETLAEGAT